MVKFYFCYIWLGFGFLVAFKIFFSEKRVFRGFPTSLITMLVLMLGELDYQDKLFPKNNLINLTKKKADGVVEYIGVSESEDDFLQFAGGFENDFF